MGKFCFPECCARLGKFTDNAAVKSNVTEWVSVNGMHTRLVEIRSFLPDLEIWKIEEILRPCRENSNIDKLMPSIKML